MLDEMVSVPPSGRTFSQGRRVRLGDVTPSGRLRLDALARYLQDVSGDDSDDAGINEPGRNWVVRRTVIAVEQAPVIREAVDVTTWCSGVGGRWAERRVSVRGEAGGAAEAATLWVYVDVATGRPVRLPANFDEVFGAAAAGRTIKARLHLPPPSASADRRRWPLRASDFDVLGHVNNAAYWEAVEELLAERHGLRPPLRAVLEYGAGLNPDAACELLTVDEADGLSLWLVAGEVVAASARVYVSR